MFLFFLFLDKIIFKDGDIVFVYYIGEFVIFLLLLIVYIFIVL